MATIENLEAAVDANTDAVNAAVAKIDALNTNPSEERVQAAADIVAADAARLAAKSV